MSLYFGKNITMKRCQQTGRTSQWGYWGTISVIFGMRFSLVVHYTTVKWDEVCFATLLWQNNEQQNDLIREFCFPNCKKNIGNKVAFVGLWRRDRPNRPRYMPLVSNRCIHCYKNACFYKIRSQSWRKGRPAEGCGTWLKRAPHICLRTFSQQIDAPEQNQPRTGFTHFPFQHSYLSDTSKKFDLPRSIASKVGKRSWRRFT